MKTPPIHQQAVSQKGMALVLVLSCVVLIAMLIVSFLMLVRTDQQASSAYATTAEVRLLGDIPINMAIGQIRRGSEQLGYKETWASQPGMIRTYGLENDGTGYRARATGLYKLYSDDKMVVNNNNVTPTSGGLSKSQVGTEIAQDEADLATWNIKPGMFTDINEPVPVRVEGSSAANVAFPIVDPRALTPGAGAEPVQGFDFDHIAVPGGQRPTSITDTNTRLPMPVKWIYVLKDGTFSTPTSADSAKASFATGNAPTANNPIVGRIAFWTDDESCKVNVNTASEGTPWYTPLTTNDSDREFAERLPAHFEYSRAPGHPAQTSLSPVFQMFSSSLAVDPGISQTQLRDRLEFYHRINPRLNWGGTMGGTRVAELGENIVPKTDRLYANLDELLLTKDRQLQDASLSSERLNLARFFLTTSSRAPEMCLMNKFRFSLWPNWASANQRTSIDNIMELVNSSGVRGGGSSYGNRGAFDRGLGWSFFRKTPFSNNTGASQYSIGTKSDYSSNMQRMLEGVLDRMTGTAVSGAASNYTRTPGFGNASFVEKYGLARRNQIMVSMMDMLRSTVDAYRPVNGTKYSYTPPQNASLNAKRIAEYSVAPLRVSGAMGSSRGFGRVPTVSEVAVVFMGVDPDSEGNATAMQAFLILEPFTPFSGPPAWSSNVFYQIKGLQALRVNVNNIEYPLFPNNDILVNKVNFNPSLMAGGNKSPFAGFFTQFAASDEDAFSPKNPASIAPDVGFPFISEKIPLTSGVENFKFSGGELELKIAGAWAPIDDAESESLHNQTLEITLAGYAAPSPYRVSHNLKRPYFNEGDVGQYDTLSKRLSLLLSNDGTWHPEVLIRKGDMVRSTQLSGVMGSSNPSRGDMRITSALREVPQKFFAPTGGAAYRNETVEILHDLRCGAFTPMNVPFLNDSADFGRLIFNLNYNPETRPAVPMGITAALNVNNRPGDWDNGVGEIEDGPYINRADNGSRWFGPSGGYYGRGGDEVGPSSDFDHSFSLNRNAASAVIFGGIPSGIDPTDPANKTKPWQTLLFCPNPASRSTPSLGEPTATDHEGFGAPRDHLLLDLFWMPAIQPYAVSEALSSAGKINMNYRMVPFSHIERSTGIYAAMKPTRVIGISRESATGANNYKNPSGHRYETHYLVNVAETLTGFNHRFDDEHDIFRSASEICEIYLVPERIPNASYASDVPSIPSYAGMNAWWNGNTVNATSTPPMGLTGDNAREAPYNDLYPRLTTRSNTFTVHFKVQTLTKARSSNPDEWVEGVDVVTAEHRGSAVLERYIDPNNYQVASINQGGDKFADSWDGFFRFRIVSRKDFTP